MSKSDFESLSFVPLPLLANEEKYSDFDDLFGKDPDEKDCPSSQKTAEAEIDEKHKGVLVSAKVRTVIICGQCLKPRCVYSRRKLNVTEQAYLTDLKDSHLYSCGSSLFPSASECHDTIVVGTTSPVSHRLKHNSSPQP